MESDFPAPKTLLIGQSVLPSSSNNECRQVSKEVSISVSGSWHKGQLEALIFSFVRKRHFKEYEAHERDGSFVQARPVFAVEGEGDWRFHRSAPHLGCGNGPPTAAGRSSSTSGGGCRDPVVQQCLLCDELGRWFAGGCGEDTRCRRTSCFDDRGPTAVSRSDVEAPLCTVAAEQPAYAEDHEVEDTRPGAGSFGVRRRGTTLSVMGPWIKSRRLHCLLVRAFNPGAWIRIAFDVKSVASLLRGEPFVRSILQSGQTSQLVFA